MSISVTLCVVPRVLSHKVGMRGTVKNTMNDLVRPDYYYIPAVVATEVQPHESYVWAVVYWFERMKDGRCTASNARIAEALPYKSSAVSVANALTVLEEAGLVVRVFKDAAKRVRSEVCVTVDTRKVSPTGETGYHPQVKQVSPTGEQNSKSNNKRKNTSAVHPRGERNVTEIPLVIAAFAEFNPACKHYYGNKTQRTAADHLLTEHGLEKLLAVIRFLPLSNGKEYTPTITTPLQLEQKWVALESAARRMKGKQADFIMS